MGIKPNEHSGVSRLKALVSTNHARTPNVSEVSMEERVFHKETVGDQNAL